jgi:hypothetical protein
MRLQASLGVLFLLTSHATAQDLLGPGDVWPGFAYGLCDAYDLDLSCLKSAGAPEGAMRFILAADADPDIGMLVIPTAFTELGAVDLIEVDIPGMANTNWQQMLVNGEPGIVWLSNWTSYQPGNDGGTRAVLRRYPQASPSGRVVVQGHRRLPGGIQRFVMADMLVDGCRGCDPVGSSLFQLDFIDGALSGVMHLGWVLADQEGSSDQLAADLRSGDIALLQTLLNVHGFQAGAMDGVAGPETRAALAEFKAEHCLAAEADLSPKVVQALIAHGPRVGSPPCARALAPVVTDPLGLVDGQYVSDARLCPPGDPAVPAEIGDMSYSMSVNLKKNRFSWGESGCTILTATPRGAAVELGLACMSEGFPNDQTETVTPEPPDAFSWRGDRFLRCGSPAAVAATEPVAPKPVSGPVFPLADTSARVNAIYGAAGPGDIADPLAYSSGQYHVGLDLRAKTGTEVLAPVDGRVVYYHRKAASGASLWMQTFIVVRDTQNRDWIFAHVACTKCDAVVQIGDWGIWPKSAQFDVVAGNPLGSVADLVPEGGATHLHIGLSTKPLVGPDGDLLPAFHSGNWARLLYREDEPGAQEAAAAKAAQLGFIDPLGVLRP